MRSAEVAARLGERAPVATRMLIRRARAELFLGAGEFSRSQEEAEVLLALARETADRAAEAGALVQIASALQWQEDFAAARQHVREAVRIAEEVQADGPLSGGLYVQGYLNALNGRLDERSRTWIARSRSPVPSVTRTGRARRCQSWQSATPLTATRASGGWRCCATTPGQATRLADQSLEIATATRLRKYESWAWRIKGESATARRAWSEAEEALDRALTLAESIGQPRHTWLSQAALGQASCSRSWAGRMPRESATEPPGRSSRT